MARREGVNWLEMMTGFVYDFQLSFNRVTAVLEVLDLR